MGVEGCYTVGGRNRNQTRLRRGTGLVYVYIRVASGHRSLSGKPRGKHSHQNVLSAARKGL